MKQNLRNKSQHPIRTSAPSMLPDSSITAKSIFLGSTNPNTMGIPGDQDCQSSSCHPECTVEPVLPRYFLLGRALALNGQTERVGRVSRRLSPFTPPSSSPRSVSETIESACEVALSSVLDMEGNHCSSIDIDNDDDDDDDMNDEMIRKYRRDLLKDDMGLFLDRLFRMRNEMHDESDTQSSDEDDDDFSHFGY